MTERFLVSEVVREKIFHLTEQEVPYATTVEVVTFDESERCAAQRPPSPSPAGFAVRTATC